METRDIEIRRNVVERALMAAKEYAKEHLRLVVYCAIGLLATVLLFSAGYLYYENREADELARFEKILDDYRNLQFAGEAERTAALEKTASEIIAASDSSYWGYVRRNGYYVAAGLYYDARMYEKALASYLAFADRSPRSFFAPLGLQQAARSYEATGRNREAIAVYERLVKDYADSAVADQILYDAGRLYQMEGDLFKSRESFNRLMTLFPKSPFARKARERLMLLGLIEVKKG
ncbi:MAG: tetratricopeptide repeat protein [Spirochaetes bacterium]|jgi:tetratricopeptide (TPR) repeat protein|nr:tetratricopeptide repeat protein [Spirochaetota bacterium]